MKGRKRAEGSSRRALKRSAWTASVVFLIATGCTDERAEVMPEEAAPGSVVHSVHEFEIPPSPREPTGLRLQKGGFSFDCMECHRSLEAKWNYGREMVEHQHIELKHGTNRFCLNCHHPENRNAYVDYDGSEISSSTVEELCHKCHGPQYRDWKNGVHGRVNGYWNVSYGEKVRLQCTQCHNPHDPAFKAMPPAEAPTYPPRAAGQPGAHADKDPHGKDAHNG